MAVVCDCRPFVFEKQFVCLCFSISDGAFNIGCDANLYQNGANKFPASCFIIVHNTGPINIAGCNLLCCLCLFLVTIFFVIFFRKDQKLPDVKDSVLKFFLTASLLPHLLWKLTKRVSFSGQLNQGHQIITQWSVESICSRFWHFTANLLLGHVHRIYHFVNGKCYLGSNIYGVAIWGEPERKFIYRDWWR